MPSADPEARSSPNVVFFAVAILFVAGFAAFFAWSYTQRVASREAVEAERQQARARDEAEVARARAERGVPPAARDAQAEPRSTSPQTAPAPHAPRRPAVRELENGDREVTLLDGIVVLQPKADLARFALFAEGETNSLGLPSGVLSDGRWVYENMPVTIDRNGQKVGILTRIAVIPVTGDVAEGDDAHVRKN